MRQIWAICALELKRLLQNPRSYFIMFGMPLLFTLLFGGLLGRSSSAQVRLLLVDEDHTAVSAAYRKQLSESGLFNIESAVREDAEQQIEDKKAAGIVILPAGLENQLAGGEKAEAVLQRSPDFTASAAATQLMADTLAQIEKEVQAAVAWSRYSGQPWESMYEKIAAEATAKPVKVEKETVTKQQKNEQLGNIDARAAGFSMMFVMIVMMSAAGTILEARRTGVWQRLLSAPVQKHQLIAGYMVSFFLLGWLQFGMLMLLTHLLFHVVWGDVAGLFVLVSALLLAIVGLALFIAGLVKTVEQQSALGNLLVVSTCMVSGVYWPITIEPKLMQQAAVFLPQTWAMRGFTELIAHGGSAADILPASGVLLLFALLFFILGVKRISYN